MRITTAFAAAGIALAALTGTAAVAGTAPVYTGTFSNVALSGYDPVAYFKQNMPVKGSDEFKTTWNGAEWHFANAADLAAFKAEPTKYAPQYGGYCAWAVSKGSTASGDPKVWKIVDNKLYINYSPEIGVKWSKNIPANIQAADANWPKIISK
ncbi:MAG: hypothetical protein JO290_03915 [Sphingomonadaceae bacterium]|nr:hypothetical protein [Sphingomonadaceae bacterium]